jgi:hypothetical protein
MNKNNRKQEQAKMKDEQRDTKDHENIMDFEVHDTSITKTPTFPLHAKLSTAKSIDGSDVLAQKGSKTLSSFFSLALDPTPTSSGTNLNQSFKSLSQENQASQELQVYHPSTATLSVPFQRSQGSELLCERGKSRKQRNHRNAADDERMPRVTDSPIHGRDGFSAPRFSGIAVMDRMYWRLIFVLGLLCIFGPIEYGRANACHAEKSKLIRGDTEALQESVCADPEKMARLGHRFALSCREAQRIVDEGVIAATWSCYLESHAIYRIVSLDNYYMNIFFALLAFYALMLLKDYLVAVRWAEMMQRNYDSVLASSSSSHTQKRTPSSTSFYSNKKTE